MKRDHAHMARVASLPCVICGYWPVEVHHVIHRRYSQRRAPDTETIPLCTQHHRELHAGKATWAAQHGEDRSYLPIVKEELERLKCQEV